MIIKDRDGDEIEAIRTGSLVEITALPREILAPVAAVRLSASETLRLAEELRRLASEIQAC